MPKITVLVGLPGSGKSYYIKQNSDSKTIIVDDPKNANELPDKLTSDLIIADCHLCREKTRESLHKILQIRYQKAEINYVFFENNPEQCLQNVKFRNDGRFVEPTIKNYSKEYNIPDNATVLPVFDTSTLKSNPNNKRRKKLSI